MEARKSDCMNYSNMGQLGSGQQAEIAGLLLNVLSILLGYENLIENRQQSAQNDVAAANDQQARYLLGEIRKEFTLQNQLLYRLISDVETLKKEIQDKKGVD